MAKLKYSSWWLLLIAGIILLLIGFFGIIQPQSTFLYLVKYLGFASLLSGIFLFLHAFSTKTPKGEHRWLIAEAVTDVAVASLLIFNPLLTVVAFPLLIGVWIIVRGFIKILHFAYGTTPLIGLRSVLVVGIISLLSGMLILMFPTNNGQGLSNLLCISALLSGGLYIFDAIRFKRFENTVVALL